METREPTQIYTLNETEPAGLAFSVAPLQRVRAGYKFLDEQGREQTAFDYTMTNDFARCPLLFMESYIRGVTPKRKGLHLNFGAVWHKALAVWYRTGSVDQAIAVWQEFEDMEGEELKTRANGIKMVSAYAERYSSERWEILEIETPIVFKFSPGRYHTVIPDMVVKENGRIYGVEHKHTKSIHINYFKQFKPNQQLDGQVAGIRAKFGDCDGIIVNPVEIQKGGRNGRPSPYFGFGPRDVSTRTIEDVEWWRRDMEQVYQDIERAVSGGYFRAVRSQCHSFGEGCAFRDLHTNHGDEYLLREYFEPRIWNPLDRLNEGVGSGEA